MSTLSMVEKNIFLQEENVNFLILVSTVSCIILASALRCTWLRRTRDKIYQIGGQVITIPDCILGTEYVPQESIEFLHYETQNNLGIESESGKLNKNIQYALALCGYFGAMLFSAILVSKTPRVMAVLQHFGISFFVLASSRELLRSKLLSYTFGLIFCGIWLVSIVTPYRWILNNIIVCLTTLMTSHLRFKNFKSLQIFLWIAFLYDVGLLNRLPTSAETNLFSVGKCNTLLCDLSTYSAIYELPTVFSIRIGSPRSFVYLGAGDIVIGSLIANYTAENFNSTKYIVLNVVFFACSVLVLMGVSTPFPALLTIVPSGTTSIIISAAVSKRFSVLLSSVGDFNKQENKHNQLSSTSRIV